MKIIHEFKTFATRGNVLDLAVGIIIGAAFGKIVTSFVNDVLMPPIGMLVGGVDFSRFAIKLSDNTEIFYGKFLNTVIDFVIVAFAIFLLIKAVNNFQKKSQTASEETAVPSQEISLLTEIRDLLKK